MNIQKLATNKLIPDPNNPRKSRDEAKIKSLVASFPLYGILVPLIVFLFKDLWQIVDGHCRWEAAKLLDLAEVPCVVLPQRPSPAELLKTQLIIQIRSDIDPMSQAEAHESLLRLQNCSATELAQQLLVSNAAVSNSLSLLKLEPELRLAVRERRLGASAGVALARMSADQRAKYAERAIAGELTRDDLNKAACKKPRKALTRQRRVICALPGSTITIAAQASITFDFLITELSQVLTRVKKAQQQGLDVSTLERVLRDTAKTKSTPTNVSNTETK